MARLKGSKNKGNFHRETTLTQRETEIVELMFTGAQNKEIAFILCISPDTVKQHLKNLYGKLNVHNKIELLNKTRWLTASPQPVFTGTAATETHC